MYAGLKFVITLAALLIVMAPPVLGQTANRPGFATARPVSPAEAVAALLQSGDPREQAWGAWYAGRDVLPHLIPHLQRVVAQRSGGGSLAAFAAFDAAVDALVQLHAPVPEELLRVIFARSRAAALILASHNRPEVSDFLLDLVAHEKGEAWFAAANLLLPGRSRGFAALVLKPVSIRAEIYISDIGNALGSSGFGVGTSGGCGGQGIAPGLPPWVAYTLTSDAQSGVVVLATGPTPIYYRRTVSGAGVTPNGSSSFRNGPSTDDRLRYLAVLAGLDERELPLRATERQSVRWQGADHLQQVIQGVRADIVNRHAHLVELLLRRGALIDDEAQELPPVSIDVVLHDVRADKTSPLARH